MKEIIATLGVETGASRTAIKKWRQRGEVPPKYWFPMLKAAAGRGLPLGEGDFVFGKPRKAAKRRKVAA